MANRFYFAPIDPGYGAFGAAIAAGMGQAADAFTQAQLRKQEEERYRERMRIEQERYDEAQLQRKQDIEADMRRRGYFTPEAGATVSVGPGGMPMIVPRQLVPRQHPATPPATPAGPATGIIPQATGAVPAPVTAPTIPEATGAAGLTGSAPTAATPPAAGATEVAPTAPTPPAPSPITSARELLGMPEGSYVDPRINRVVQFDPSKSEAAQTEAYSWRTQQERMERERRDTANFIAKVMADGKIDLAEIPEIRARNMKPEDFDPDAFDPDKLLERHMRQFEKERNIIHQHTMAEIREREKNNSVQRAMTEGQEQASLLLEVAGMTDYHASQGKTPDQIFDLLQSHVAKLGEGVVRGQIMKSLHEGRQLAASQALASARRELEMDPLRFSDEPAWNQKVLTRADEIERQMREQERRRQANWDRPPARESTGRTGADIGGGGPITAAAQPTIAPTMPLPTSSIVPTRADIETNAAMFRGSTQDEIRQYLLDRGAAPEDANWAAKKYGKRVKGTTALGRTMSQGIPGAR